ncbi:MAG: glycoside hydrolase family 3 C-terminal domain-containing protein, partial [Muribaculaceae bacterium]|nr:glycoside hydrolase family 3 C-terminal domain-containing protein [Muribaculaceae bacterium]
TMTMTASLTGSYRFLTEILRDEWGFDGVVITDWGGAHDTKEAALNGLDIEMGSYTNGLTSESAFGYDDYYLANPYLQMIKNGEVPESTVDEKARNILRLIFRTSMNTDKPFGSKCTPEHYAAAKLIGDESVVLLKNSGILPIDGSKYNNILVVGDNAVRRLTDGGGSSELKPKDYVSPLSALQALWGEKVKYAPGYTCGRTLYEAEDIIPQEEQDKLRAEAVEMAKEADLVIYIGGLNKNAWQDCESTDRREYELPYGQNQLIEEIIAVNPNIVIANIAGNAYAMPWVKKVPAILHSSYLGTMGGATIADVLAGNVNPSGKLPYSIPVKIDDCGANSFGEISYPGIEVGDADIVAIPGSVIEGGKKPQQTYKEDILVGYRWHDTKKIPALFPFGFGLSYTDFEYGKPVVSAKTLDENGKIEIEIPVTNIGNREGNEIIQLYISDLKSSLLRPVKELKGFDKVRLAPGETKTVKFEITPEHLKFFDDNIHQWIAEPGKFKAMIGASSTDIKHTLPFEYK